MYCVRKVLEDLWWVGGNDRRLAMFEGVYAVPNGVSYNSYLLLDDKTVLFDTVDPSVSKVFFENVDHVLAGRKLDYLVIHHMEPDHSGTVSEVLLRHPETVIVCSDRIRAMLQQFRGGVAPQNAFHLVKEGDTFETGHHTLTFLSAPMVHWPEVMVSYDLTTRTLFSADAFGTFGAIDGGITDSQVDPSRYWDEMRRYYACIVGKYGGPVQKALQKVRTLPVGTICSTHGPVWQRQIAKVLDIYDRLSRYEGEPGVVVAYASMYGNTEQMAERIARELASREVGPIRVYNLSYADPSVVLRDVFRFDTLIVGGPTYNGNLFPPVAELLDRIAARGIPRRRFGWFGSFCWAGASVRLLAEFAQKMKWEPLCDPVEMKQGYSHEMCDPCATLAEAVAGCRCGK